MTALCLITYCKGRLAHLQQTLPAMLAQTNTEVVVVDYDCPEHAADWVERHHPTVRTVRITAAPLFNAAAARNAGAAAASAPWLMFVDADMLPQIDFGSRLVPDLQAGRYYLPMPRDPGKAWSSIVCSRADFARVGGYDATLQGWGVEDDDIIWRLGAAGLQATGYDADWLRLLPHDHAASTRFHEIGSKRIAHAINACYVLIKHDLIRHYGSFNLPADLLATVYGEVRRTLLANHAAGQTACQVTLTLPAHFTIPAAVGMSLGRTWVYEYAYADDRSGAVE